ncbi:hypothetical protein Zmor_015642 [Zophobas morio]|uniref:O-acyltransferase n=1 Tax=Zophobas morio TaxID=2755281 RepID=A0AA38MHR9_9CUCU|nr:hypothetical protein Zmor_015642 [Zophobas morio]
MDVRKKIWITKEFKIRDSPLITRFKNSDDWKTLYNVFVMMFIAMLTYTACDDFMLGGSSYLGLRLIWLGFDKPHFVILVWCTSNVLACVNYVCFMIWARIRTSLKPTGTKLWDTLWISLLIVYYFGFLYGLQVIGNLLSFSMCSSAVLFIEQVRLLMKQHSFIRTNAPRVLAFEKHSNDDSLQVPNFGKFLYFLFAPTMIYQDDYPRTSHIRWKFVIYNFGEIFATMWFVNLVGQKFLFLSFRDLCLRKFPLGEIITPVFTHVVVGFFILLSTFYTILHASQNAFAEMLRFGDRMFYKEWWHSKSLSEFYRTWNVLVHEWLYMFIFRDVYEKFVLKNETAAKFTVFVVSAVVHEWVLFNIFRFFLPVHLVLFLLTGAVFAVMNLLDVRWGNLLVLYSLALGFCIQVHLFTIEFFARLNCPVSENVTGLEFYVPRFITCNCINL